MGSQETLQLENPASFTGAISGFAGGNIIDLAGISATMATFSSDGVLTVQESNGATLALNVPGVQGGQGVIVASDNQGGTDIELGPAPPINGMTYVFTSVPFNTSDTAAPYSGPPGNIRMTVTFVGLPPNYSGAANLLSYVKSWSASAFGQTLSPTNAVNQESVIDFNFKNGQIAQSPPLIINVENENISFDIAGGFAYMQSNSNPGYAGASGPVVWTLETITPCFAGGTRILTLAGEVRVEDLDVGNLVLAQFAGHAFVKWIGRRRVDCLGHPDPCKIWPVRVRAGAFDEGLPHRDLWLSPDHAIYTNDVLIPIKHLINGMTIEQVPVDEVTYYHIELDQHDVLFAEGMSAESYLDTGDRSKFTNGGGPIALHPDFSVRMWEAMGCAPLVVTGSALTSVRTRLLQRAAGLAVRSGQKRSTVRKSRAA
jgi:hypothetical protein